METRKEAPLEIRGSLQTHSLPEVMRRIYTERRTGELLVVKDVIRRRVYFEMGLAVFAASNRKGDRLGAFLLRRGDINQTVFDMINTMVPRGRRFGQMLVEMGIINEDQLTKAVHEQVLSMIYSLFEWTKGDFEFTERTTTNVPADLKLRLSMADIILEGVGRVRDLSVVRRGMGDLNRLIAPSSDPLLRLQQASLRPLEQSLLGQVTEPTDLLSILVFSQQPAADTIRALYGLLSAGFLTWMPAQAEETVPAAKVPGNVSAPPSPPTERPIVKATITPEVVVTLPQPPLNVTVVPEAIEISLDPEEDLVADLPGAAVESQPPSKVADQPAGSQMAMPDSVVDAAQAAKNAEPGKAWEEEQRREVERLRARVGSDDPYTIFGVERNADLSHFKAAYHELLRHFHPDKFRQSSKELREEVEEIFQAVTAAWNRVQDEWQRNPRAVRGRSSAPSQTSASAPAGQEILPSDNLSQEALENMAEASYRDGLLSLMSRKYNDAAGLLRRAVQLNPDKAAYHSALALALSSNTQGNNSKVCKEAEQHYLQAIRLAPQDPSHHALLGMLYSKLGMARRAEAVYRQALKLDPRHEIALKGIASKPIDVELLMHLLTQP
ncbi:MAG TPA: DUF4388 domain-containing protein [Blastocatellia bacterium]|nr:DUF4388 domain-containing protein [Blastocatellia bacterium]